MVRRAESRESGRRASLWILAGAVVLLTALHWPHGPAFGADDHGQYLSHARAILEGRPYTDIGFIYTNYNNLIGPVAEPPGLPLLLAPLLSIGGGSLALVRVMLAAALFAFAVAARRWIAPRAGEWCAIGVTLLSVAALMQLHVTDTVMADLPFMAAIWALLELADRSERLTMWRVLALSVLGALSFTFRMAALPLIPAGILWALLRRRGDRERALLPVIAWTVAAAGVLFLLPTSSALGNEMSFGAKMVTDIRLNAPEIVTGIRDGFLRPFASNRANLAYHVIAVVIALIGVVDMLRHSPRRLAYIFAAAYLFMLVILPTRSARYLWPLFPLEWLAFATGLRFTARRLGVPRTPSGDRVLNAVLAMPLLLGVLRQAWAPLPRTFSTDPDVQAVVSALKKDGGAEHVRVVFFSPRALTWETRIPAMGLFEATPEGTLDELSRLKITHVVLGEPDAPSPQGRSIERVVRDHPEVFELSERSGEFSVYRRR